MNIFDLSPEGNVRLHDSLVSNNSYINIRTFSNANNLFLAQKDGSYSIYPNKSFFSSDLGIYNSDLQSAEFSPNGKWLVTTQSDYPEPKLWPLDSVGGFDVELELETPFKFNHAIRYFFSPNSKYLCFYSTIEPNIYVYQLLDVPEDGKPPVLDSAFVLTNLDPNNLLSKYSFSKNDDTLYVLSRNKEENNRQQ